MVYAALEILGLLLLAASVGLALGFAIGTARTMAMRRLVAQRRTKAQLRHRLTEAQQAIVMLERTIAAAADDEDVVVTGTRLSERVRRAREEATQQEASETEPVS